MKLSVATCYVPVDADICRNRQYVLQQMRTASAHGADVAHFPEACLSGYAGTDFPSYRGFDWPRLHACTHDILNRARHLGLWVILGSMHPLTPPHKPHDSVYIIDARGRLVDRYDKRFCSTEDLAHYSPGNHAAVFSLKGIRCGVLICYEYAFPELYRQYKRRGVQVVFHSYHAGHASSRRVKVLQRQVGKTFLTLNRGASLPEVRMPAAIHAGATSNHVWISCSNTAARHSCFPSFFVRADGIITGRLHRNIPGVLLSTVETTARLYDGTAGWRERAMRGVLHSGTLVQDQRSAERTRW